MEVEKVATEDLIKNIKMEVDNGATENITKNIKMEVEDPSDELETISNMEVEGDSNINNDDAKSTITSNSVRDVNDNSSLSSNSETNDVNKSSVLSNPETNDDNKSSLLSNSEKSGDDRSSSPLNPVTDGTQTLPSTILKPLISCNGFERDLDHAPLSCQSSVTESGNEDKNVFTQDGTRMKDTCSGAECDRIEKLADENHTIPNEKNDIESVAKEDRNETDDKPPVLIEITDTRDKNETETNDNHPVLLKITDAQDKKLIQRDLGPTNENEQKNMEIDESYPILSEKTDTLDKEEVPIEKKPPILNEKTDLCSMNENEQKDMETDESYPILSEKADTLDKEEVPIEKMPPILNEKTGIESMNQDENKDIKTDEIKFTSKNENNDVKSEAHSDNKDIKMNEIEFTSKREDNGSTRSFNTVKESIVHLSVEGVDENSDEKSIFLTSEEVKECLLKKIGDYMNSPVNPLYGLRKKAKEFETIGREQVEEFSKLYKGLQLLERKQEIFLRKINILPKLKMSHASVSADLPVQPVLKPDSIKKELSITKVATPPNKTTPNATNKTTSSSDIECIDLTDETEPIIKTAKRGPSFAEMTLMKHPAPLPPRPFSSNLKLVPPKPRLKIFSEERGIVLQWDMPPNPQNRFHDPISTFDIFGYQETKSMPINTLLWKKIGSVKAMTLPMACTLTQFVDGNKYHFSIRAVDIHNRYGYYSDAISIVYTAKK